MGGETITNNDQLDVLVRFHLQRKNFGLNKNGLFKGVKWFTD